NFDAFMRFRSSPSQERLAENSSFKRSSFQGTQHAHGLRKTRGVALAEAGASAHQIMSWLGHQTLKEAEHYTRQASRRRAVMGEEQEQNVATPAAPVATFPKKS
ncbi:tyrosine-type recombinase/integrase, partial [Rhodovulum visakhapatnamense]